MIALVPAALRDAPAIGLLGPAWMFAVVWSTDIVAYVTGRTLGGPKLMPRVSPKKTWSGALGGLAGAVAAGIAIVLLARTQGWSPLAETSLLLVGLASAVASVLSQGGDLVESALKRRYGVKDSGTSIPGHGGVMDRLDGFFAVALLAGLYLILRRIAAMREFSAVTQTVTILGATGSIGRSTTDLLAQHPERFRVGAVVGGRDAAALAQVALATGASLQPSPIPPAARRSPRRCRAPASLAAQARPRFSTRWRARPTSSSRRSAARPASSRPMRRSASDGRSPSPTRRAWSARATRSCGTPSATGRPSCRWIPSTTPSARRWPVARFKTFGP